MFEGLVFALYVHIANSISDPFRWSAALPLPISGGAAQMSHLARSAPDYISR
jgi:hypothetical protein